MPSLPCVLLAVSALTMQPCVPQLRGFTQQQRARAAVRLAGSSAEDDNSSNAGRAAALEAQARSVAATLGGTSASVQFMMTQSMREKLAELGYSDAEVHGLSPSRAAAIIESAIPSSKQPQAKPSST